MDLGEYQSATFATKRRVVPLPNLAGKTVLDVGCDHGAWCWLAAEQGASKVVGLDRGRLVSGEGFVDLAARNARRSPFPQCEFRSVEVGAEWADQGRFDVVLMLSMYHHAYQACGDHEAVWYWLWRQTAGELLWENPVDKTDPVADRHVAYPYHRIDILRAAERWFHVEHVGPGHVPTREVWHCTPRRVEPIRHAGQVRAGAGGASKAFSYADGRRIAEVELATGLRPIPGSLNVHLEQPFDWDRGYYRARILDLVDRATGLDGAWAHRWARFYPARWNGHACMAFRFEGETYPLEFVELIAARRLRDGGDSGVLDR